MADANPTTFDNDGSGQPADKGKPEAKAKPEAAAKGQAKAAEAKAKPAPEKSQGKKGNPPGKANQGGFKFFVHQR